MLGQLKRKNSMTRKLPLKIGVLHFIGIGGIGMSGIAEALNHMGYDIQGSDMKDGPNVERLRNQGIRVLIGHDADNTLDKDGNTVAAVVYSTAVKDSNPEMIKARAEGIPVIRRAAMLAEIMRLKPSIAVAGTHGKTTTTSMVGHILEKCDCDPTIINGGIINAYNSNTRMGDGDWMVVEADESDGTFTMLPATCGIITNIDPEHMDHYKNFDEIKKAFTRFVQNLPFYGRVAACIDHPTVREMIPSFPRQVISYGQSDDADLQLTNLRNGEDGQYFDLVHEGETYRDFFLPMFGLHNALNACAALAIGHELELTMDCMRTALASFNGVKRRFTKTGEVNGVTIIDDYGHHPTEICAVLKAAQDSVDGSRYKTGRVIAVVQPHRYSRLAALFDDFVTCFEGAECVIVADVYGAGEDPVEGADRDHLVAAIGDKAIALENEEDLADMLSKIVQPGDIVLCLGAGTITNWAADLPAKLEVLMAPVAANGTH
jgi:UDP-N-acetylmuramate--alanine ligase